MSKVLFGSKSESVIFLVFVQLSSSVIPLDVKFSPVNKYVEMTVLLFFFLKMCTRKKFAIHTEDNNYGNCIISVKSHSFLFKPQQQKNILPTSLNVIYLVHCTGPI